METYSDPTPDSEDEMKNYLVLDIDGGTTDITAQVYIEPDSYDRVSNEKKSQNLAFTAVTNNTIYVTNNCIFKSLKLLLVALQSLAEIGNFCDLGVK